MAPSPFSDPDGAIATAATCRLGDVRGCARGGTLPGVLRAQPTLCHEHPLCGVRAGSARSLPDGWWQGSPREIDGRLSHDRAHDRVHDRVQP
jgi:hypothetical protein